MWRRWLKGSLAGAVPLLSVSDGLAASLRATAASSDLITNLALGGAVFAGAGALARPTRDRGDYPLDATYEQPMLQAIHDTWNEQFGRVFRNRDVLVFTAPKGGRHEREALNDAVRDASDYLAIYGPELLDNGSDNYSPLLSFWATLVNGFPAVIGSFTDRLSERIVANTIQFGPEEGLIRYIDGTDTLYSAVLSLAEGGEESSGAIIPHLLRLQRHLP